MSECSHAETIYSYFGEKDDELSFETGVVLKILEKVNADWWMAFDESRCRKGLVPTEHLKETCCGCVENEEDLAHSTDWTLCDDNYMRLNEITLNRRNKDIDEVTGNYLDPKASIIEERKIEDWCFELRNILGSNDEFSSAKGEEEVAENDLNSKDSNFEDSDFKELRNILMLNVSSESGAGYRARSHSVRCKTELILTQGSSYMDITENDDLTKSMEKMDIHMYISTKSLKKKLQHKTLPNVRQLMMKINDADKCLPYNEQTYYVGKMSRLQSEEFLMKKYINGGGFLLRDSESRHGDLTLSLRQPNNRVDHIWIRILPGKFVFNSIAKFETIEEIFQKYSKEKLTSRNGENIFLREESYLVGNMNEAECEKKLMNSQFGTFLMYQPSENNKLLLSVRFPINVDSFPINIVNKRGGHKTFELHDCESRKSIHDVIEEHLNGSLRQIRQRRIKFMTI